VKDAGDVLLIGYRSVPILTGGAVSIGPRTVVVPATTALGTYRLLACADDLLAVKESDDTNNCVASAAAVRVDWPDLAATALGSLPAGAAPGTSFSVTDTVQNAGAVSAGASLVRYYFSLDAVKDPGDVLLTGYRSVPILAGGAISSGTRTVTVRRRRRPGAIGCWPARTAGGGEGVGRGEQLRGLGRGDRRRLAGSGRVVGRQSARDRRPGDVVSRDRHGTERRDGQRGRVAGTLLPFAGRDEGRG